MRNQYYLYGVLSAVILFGSCTDESKQFKTFSQKVLSFDTAEVTIEKDAVTRTWLVNSKDVIWSPSDDIGIFSDLTGFEGGQMYYITDDEMYTSGKMIFRGDEISGNQFYAYYPAYVSNPWEPDAENPEIIRYTMPKYVAFEQIPSSGGSISFGEPDYTPRTSLSKIPLVAKSADNNFVFKQTMGMLCFSLTGSMNVKKLILTGNNGELLYGDGYVDLSLDEPIFKIDEKSENVNDTIVFDVYYDTKSNGSLGVSIDTDPMAPDPRTIKVVVLNDEPTDFYFPVPVQNYSKGFTLRVDGYDELGNYVVMYKTTDKSVNVERGKMKVFPSLDSKINVEENKRQISLSSEDTFTDNGYSTEWEVHTTDDNMIEKLNSVVNALNAMKSKGDDREILLIMPEAKFIPARAFKGLSLSGFIGENVETVGSEAFREEFSHYDRFKMTISLPKVVKINDNAFSGTPIDSLNFPLLKELGDNAFYNCDVLEDINLPALKSMGNNVFSLCSNLKSVNLPTVNTIGSVSFYLCSSLTSISLPSLKEINGTGAFSYCSLETINLPNLEIAGGGDFANNEKLIEVYLPKLKGVPSGMFSECESLTSINLP